MKIEPATRGQIVFAKEIADALNLELPEELSKDAYWYFINQNILDYEEFTKSNPTQAQINFATEISAALMIALPDLETKEDYSKFISEHIKDYEEFCTEMNSDPLSFENAGAIEPGYF